MLKSLIQNRKTTLALLTACALPALGCRKSDQTELVSTNTPTVVIVAIPALKNTNFSAADNVKEDLAQRKKVKEDLGTVEMLLKAAETKPAVGTFVELEAGGIKKKVFIDQEAGLAKLVRFGLNTVKEAYILTDDEKKIVKNYEERLAKLLKELSSPTI